MTFSDPSTIFAVEVLLVTMFSLYVIYCFTCVYLLVLSQRRGLRQTPCGAHLPAPFLILPVVFSSFNLQYYIWGVSE